MWAEMAGKLSMGSPSPQDRLEDTLTDAVFSALRYLPRQVLAEWLRTVLPPPFSDEIDENAAGTAIFRFWPSLPGGVEPDLVIRVGPLMVVIEAKYLSPFSSRSSRHQLTVEWSHARAVARLEGLRGPIVVAVTADLTEPADIDLARREVALDSGFDGSTSSSGLVTWCPWQSVAEAILRSQAPDWSIGSIALMSDLFELMEKRGVRFVYEGFKLSDWWLLGAAAEAAAERVYPAIAEFAREITASGVERSLLWGGTDVGVVWYESKHPAYTDRWHRNYIQLPFLHTAFGTRLVNRFGLYVLFAFNYQAISVGFWVTPRRHYKYGTAGQGIANWLVSLDPKWMVIESSFWHLPPVPVSRELITTDRVVGRLETGGQLRIERSWSPADVTSTGPIIDALVELSESLEIDGSVLAALEADGALDRSHPAFTPSAAGAQDMLADQLLGSSDEAGDDSL